MKLEFRAYRFEEKSWGQKARESKAAVIIMVLLAAIMALLFVFVG